MAIEYEIDTTRTGSDSLLVQFRCSADEAPKLAAALREAYRGKGTPPQLVPAPKGGRFAYYARVPDSRTGFERTWPHVSLKLLLNGAAPPPPPRPAAAGTGAHRGDTPDRATTAPAGGRDASQSAPPPQAPLPARRPEPPGTTAPATGERRRAADEKVRAASALGPASAPRDDESAALTARLRSLGALLDAGDAAAVETAIATDEPDPALRALRGRALLALDRDGEALRDLRYAWSHGAGEGMALSLARRSWRHGEFDVAASAYAQALRDDEAALTAQDLAALCELCVSGEDRDLDVTEQLAVFARFLEDAEPAEHTSPLYRSVAERALRSARQRGTGDRLILAYQQLLDVLIDGRDGAGLATLLGELHDDYWQGHIDSAGHFEVLDEVAEYQEDYPDLRERLVVGYGDIIQRELARVGQGGEIEPPLRDAYRALRRLDRHAPLVAEVRELLAGRRLGQVTDEFDERPPAVSGRRIALVGGHERTREHVRRRLERWGARVDEVPPPTNGRVAEREIFDKVHQSDLILLIVRYMGHDMSTAVGNLRRRELLRGEVLEINSRGTSGICREISRWAQRG